MSIDFKEVLYLTLNQLKPAIPALLAATVLTLALLVLLLGKSEGLWVNSRMFRFMGIFYCLDRRGQMSLACSWMKFILVVVYLCTFRKFSVMHYVILIIPGIIYMLLCRSAGGIISAGVWLVLEMAGLFAASLICGYYRDVSGSTMLVIIYIIIAIFLAACALYIFVTEIEEISGDRLRLRLKLRLPGSGRKPKTGKRTIGKRKNGKTNQIEKTEVEAGSADPDHPGGGDPDRLRGGVADRQPEG